MGDDELSPAIDRTRKGLVAAPEPTNDETVGKKKRGPKGPFPPEIRAVIDEVVELLLKKSKVQKGDEDDEDYKDAIKENWETLCVQFPDIATSTFEAVSAKIQCGANEINAYDHKEIPSHSVQQKGV